MLRRPKHSKIEVVAPKEEEEEEMVHLQKVNGVFIVRKCHQRCYSDLKFVLHPRQSQKYKNFKQVTYQDTKLHNETNQK